MRAAESSPPRGLRPFRHVLAGFDGDDGFGAAARRFVGAGREAAERMVVVVPELRSAQLAELVDEAGDGLTVLYWEEIGHPGRVVPAVLLPRSVTGGVRFLMESVWPGRTADERRACGQMEAVAGLALGDREATLTCLYDDSLDPAVLASAAATHPEVLTGGSVGPSAAFDPGWPAADRARPLPPASAPVTTLRFDRGSQQLSRGFAVQLAQAHGFDAVVVGHVELAVNELTANSVEHGGGSGVVRIWCDDDLLTCEVADHGHLADPLLGQRPVGLSIDGGRGLLLVNALADLVLVSTRPGSTTVRIQFRR